MANPRVYVYQFASGSQWAAGDSVEAYLRRLLDVDFTQSLRADRLAAVTAFLDEAFQLAHTIGWTGTARDIPQMFSLPGMPAEEAVYMIAWEQEDGVAFIASPYPLPWLDAKASRTTDSDRAVPVEAAPVAPVARPAPVQAQPQPLEVVSAQAEEAVEAALDPFSEYVRREEAARLSREPAPLAEDRDAARRFF
ncbi:MULTISPECIES: hypothetical protein [Xanthobacter]|uniref:Uncharacterized protein n=1 Tax=Xanthobacter flavus TaxID=281 RepID=A0A9W6FKK1_XANFL|nr:MULTISPECIES: hypothetical protein [Xanthobacter]MBN8918565.1 hypothetical protein [Hyphomicrobiales bacterium]MDR6333100.1 hypothetical protein [Xanthobacter flavus]NMN57492.1 hypothetical protein [Xanthobacter sp. SG618]UDQ91338.1 hypothetical protein LJE71_10230 [Xanthobacter autotrophicus]UJX47001.1 hypothetical protein D7006_21365 [Xanthobacter sp. YC-JY1]